VGLLRSHHGGGVGRESVGVHDLGEWWEQQPRGGRSPFWVRPNGIRHGFRASSDGDQRGGSALQCQPGWHTRRHGWNSGSVERKRGRVVAGARCTYPLAIIALTARSGCLPALHWKVKREDSTARFLYKTARGATNCYHERLQLHQAVDIEGDGRHAGYGIGDPVA